MKTKRILGAVSAALLSTASLVALAPAAHAITPIPNLVYKLTLNIPTSVETNGNGLFSLDLQLVQGSGNVTNTVTLSNFLFTGGTYVGTPDYTNGAETGSLATSVTLTNTDSDNELAQEFTSGVTQISFTVNETPNAEVAGDSTPTPDLFNVSILDNNLNNIPTTAADGSSTLVESNMGPTASVGSLIFSSSLSPDAGVTAVAVAPEPSSTAMFLLGTASLLTVLALRRRHSA